MHGSYDTDTHHPAPHCETARALVVRGWIEPEPNCRKCARCDVKLWDTDNYYDWLDSTTDEATGKKMCRPFNASINPINTTASDDKVRGVLGFS